MRLLRWLLNKLFPLQLESHPPPSPATRCLIDQLMPTLEDEDGPPDI